jgi:arylsulfatase A-like enzyme
MRSAPRATLLDALILALAGAVTAGAALGAWAARGYAEAGFPWMTADAARQAANRFLLGALFFLALYRLLHRLLGRLERAGPRVALAAALAAAPFGLLWAYHFNLEHAFRPSDLLEPFALWPNLRLLGLFLVLLALVAAVLAAWERRRRADGGSGGLGRRLAVAVILAAVLAALNLAPALSARGGGGAAPEHPNVLVILIDALRADHLGAYGYGRETSPELDAFAREAVVFEQAISQSTFTKASIASLFTGRAPYEHGVYWGDRRAAGGGLTSDALADRETTLAEALRTRGYLTAAWVQNSHLAPRMGFAQGFVDYRDQQGDAESIDRRFLSWLASPARLERFFVYLHYIDLHDPYRPEEPWETTFGGPGVEAAYEGIDLDEWGAWLEGVRTGRIEVSEERVEAFRALYDGQIRFLDGRVGGVFEALRERGLYDDSVIVVTSDHGDAFMEHGFVSHSAAPYDELARVPLMIRLPGGREGGRRVATQVRLIDVAPTLLELGHAPRPKRMSGCSLVPLIEGRPEDWAAERPECAIAPIEIAEVEDGPPTLGLRAGRFKYLVGPAGEELYDLEADPGERHDLIRGGASGRERELVAFRALAGEIVELRSRASAGSVELDAKTIRDLEALGYIQ